MHEQYPATDAEAFAPRTLDKRIPPLWLQQCYEAQEPLSSDIGPALPGLVLYALPIPGTTYFLGVDPAEGNPTSDESAITVLDGDGEETAVLAGRFQPGTLASYADELAVTYNNAAVMVERNNHGHAVLLWLEEHGRTTILTGHDGKAGWLSSPKGKALLYTIGATAFQTGDTTLHSLETYSQLTSIDSPPCAGSRQSENIMDYTTWLRNLFR